MKIISIVKFQGVETHLGLIDLEVPPNSSFNFYGPSKIGKTTLLLLAGGITRPNKGKVLVSGFDTRTQKKLVRKSTGLCALKDITPLYESLTVLENLKFQASINKVKNRDVSIEKQLHFFELANVAEKMVTYLDAIESLRLGLAMATIHNPKVVLVDEPEYRLSSEQKKLIPSYLKKMNDAGKTILFTTCDRQLADKADNLIDLTKKEVIKLC